jgi:methionine salvage enolase-phosphatase E1
MGLVMNANELADELQELDSKLHLINLFKAATMLRQQQAEIEALKQQVGIWEKEAMNARIKMFLYQDEIEALKAEKIRAYDNGYEDGRKPNTNKAQEK